MLIALALAALIAPEDPDGVVSTAPRGAGSVIVGAEAPTTDARPEAAQVVTVAPHNLSTSEQIERWISARAPEAQPFASDQGPQDDRRMHGFVSGSIGTNDYSAVSVGVSLPIGETGRLDLAYSQTKNGWMGYGYPYGYPGHPGYGYGYGYDRLAGPSEVYVSPRRSYRTRAAEYDGQSFGLSYRSDGRDD